jgi:hypothetical protein
LIIIWLNNRIKPRKKLPKGLSVVTIHCTPRAAAEADKQAGLSCFYLRKRTEKAVVPLFFMCILRFFERFFKNVVYCVCV